MPTSAGGVERGQEMKPFDVRYRKSHRERAGDDGAGGRPADEIEPVAEMNGLLQAFRQNPFDLFEERNRDRARTPPPSSASMRLGPEQNRCRSRSQVQLHPVVRPPPVAVAYRGHRR